MEKRHDPSAPPTTFFAVFHLFEPVSITTLVEIVEHLKPSTSPHNIIPTRIFKHFIGPSFLILINCCLVSGSVPAYFKHAIV